MEIILGKTAGFCFGVKNAVNSSKKELKNNKPVYCLGELVHNKQVTEEFKREGLIFVENLDNVSDKIIIRSHGATKQVYEEAKNKKIEIVDLTCPKVLKIHNIAEMYATEGYYIFLVGKAEHPEVIGIKSFCGKHFFTIQNIQDTEKAIEEFKSSGIKKAVIISQTTYNLKEFEKIILNIQQKVNPSNLVIKKTICEATKLRQEETAKIAKEVQLMIVVGGRHSSNSNKLYEISKNNCNNVLFIETKDEIDLKFVSNFQKIGIMAGASTPDKSIKEVVDIINKK